MSPQFYRDTPSDIDKVAELLNTGELVAIPTETVYGLAANALNPVAVSKIFSVKQRALTNPLIIHIGKVSQVTEYCEVNDSAIKLAQAFWPGALTLVLPKKSTIPDIVTAGLNSVGIRMPNHPVTLQLLQRLDFPVAAPSANPSKYISPTRANHVAESLGHAIGHILDGGPCSRGIESTIVDLRIEAGPRILRYGPISRQELEAVLDMTILEPIEASSPLEPKTSPGQEHIHYSPHTPMKAVAYRSMDEWGDSETGYILIHPHEPPQGLSGTLYPIAKLPDSKDVAQNLYSILRKADQAGHNQLIIELPPGGSEWDALRDRINRATNT